MTALLFPDEAARLRVGERLVIVRQADFSIVAGYVAPQDWVALTGPCRTCDGSHMIAPKPEPHPQVQGFCPDCRDGRRIEPLYTGCRSDRFKPGMRWCPACNDEHGNPTGRVLVGRGSIKVVPVVTESDNRYLDPPFIEVTDQGLCLLFANANDVRDVRQITLDPLPVPGRDFGIVIDCVEVA